MPMPRASSSRASRVPGAAEATGRAEGESPMSLYEMHRLIHGLNVNPTLVERFRAAPT